MLDRYPMCDEQPAQIDCRISSCMFYAGAGSCTNPAPAITLNPDGRFVCWSWKIFAEVKRIGQVTTPTPIVTNEKAVAQTVENPEVHLTARDLLARATEMYRIAHEYRTKANRLEERAKRLMRNEFHYQKADSC